MTREQAVRELKECQRCDDTEAAHCEADDVLCALLLELGYKDVVDEWLKVRKRYA